MSKEKCYGFVLNILEVLDVQKGKTWIILEALNAIFIKRDLQI